MYSNGISRRLIRYLFAESQGFLLRKRYAITNPSGFSSRLSSHEGPKACTSGPSLRKDRAMNLLPICLLIKRLNSTICRCHQSVTKVGLFADVSKTAESQNERSRF